MKKKIRSLLILALPYVVTICLPIISTLFLSKVVSDNFHEKIVTEKQKNIESAFERFQQKKEGIERLMYTVAKSNEMTEYVSLIKNDKPITSKYLAVKNMLGSLMIDSNVLAMYYYDIGDQRIITNDASYRLAERYFINRYKLTDYTAEEHIERLNALPWGMGYSISMAARMDNFSVEVIEYRMSLPLTPGSTVKGHLVMVIDAEELVCDFTEILGDSSEIYVYDSSNTLIYGHGNQYERMMDTTDAGGLRQLSDGENAVWGMVCGLDNTSWKIKIYIPDLLSGADNGAMSVSMALWVVIPVVASIVLCVYFTMINYREICEILSMFRDHTKDAALETAESKAISYRHIREQISYLMSENRDYREKISTFAQSHKYEVLDKLIRNTYDQRERVIEELRKVNLKITDGRCIVLCIRYKSSEYRTMVMDGVSLKDFVKELLYQIIEKNVEIFDTSARETICILSLSEEDDIEAVMRDICSAINVEIVYNYGIEMEIGVGNAVDSLLSVSDSYMQAKEVISYNETSKDTILMYLELEKLEDVYYYPEEFDDKIYNYLLAGKAKSAKELVRRICEENFSGTRNRISDHSVELIKERLEKSVFVLAEKNNLHGNVTRERLSEAQTINEYFDIMLELMDSISEELNSRKRSVQNQAAVKVMNYIKENYCDSELSLKQISAMFGYNEHYISDLFRSVYGEKLSVFVERMRIETACGLMKSDDLKIHDIAQRVGYVSDVTFRRVFKKVMGVTPSEYKET